MVKLSVIIPCFNGGGFIESTILSVLRQPAKGIELLVIDDGSTDDTQNVCEKYRENIRYFRTENCGTGHARNVGLKHARGEWVAFLDADDLFLSGSLNESLMVLLESYMLDGVEVLYTPWINAPMNLDGPVCVRPSELPEHIGHLPKNSFCTCIYQKRFLDENNIRFFEYQEQDIETAFRYLVFSQKPKIVTRNDIRFCLQRENPTSNTHTWKAQIMHSVKAQVYYDLLRDHATPETKEWLFQEVVKQVRFYYLDVQNSGIISRKAQKRVNKLICGCVFVDPFFMIRTHVKRYLLQCVALFMKTNSIRKHYCAIESPRTAEKYSEDSQMIMEKLQKISADIVLFK